MIDTIEISEDLFDALLPLRPNHLNPAASWAHGDGGGCLFETYGDELAFVKRQYRRTVWTLVDADTDDGGQCVLSGFHVVNRIGYLISAVPLAEGVEVHVTIPYHPRIKRIARFGEAIDHYPDAAPMAALIDLLADAMHWSAANAIRFDHAIKTATLRFTNDTTA